MRELTRGLAYREKGTGKLVTEKETGKEYHENIYYNRFYRGHRLQGSSDTTGPREAERRLRQKLFEIDEIEVYGKRPVRKWKEAAAKYLREAVKKTIADDARQLDYLSPHLDHLYLHEVSKDSLKDLIEARYAAGLSPRTINQGLEVVRRVLKLAAYTWRENGKTWLESAPMIQMEPHNTPRGNCPLSWEDQATFFSKLPRHLVVMSDFDVNTGLRESNLTGLKWTWETPSALGETIFLIPGWVDGVRNTKNGHDLELVLNSTARNIIDGERGKHPEYVFTYEGKPVLRMHTAAWRKAWRAAGLPTDKDLRKGPHNLRHTFSKRLRNAGVTEEDRADLLHHKPKNVTRHYSDPELLHLRECVEKLVRKADLKVVENYTKTTHGKSGTG